MKRWELKIFHMLCHFQVDRIRSGLNFPWSPLSIHACDGITINARSICYSLIWVRCHVDPDDYPNINSFLCLPAIYCFRANRWRCEGVVQINPLDKNFNLSWSKKSGAYTRFFLFLILRVDHSWLINLGYISMDIDRNAESHHTHIGATFLRDTGVKKGIELFVNVF